MLQLINNLHVQSFICIKIENKSVLKSLQSCRDVFLCKTICFFHVLPSSKWSNFMSAVTLDEMLLEQLDYWSTVFASNYWQVPKQI